MYKSRSFLLKKQKRGWCLRTQKKSLRKNPKLKRRNNKKKVFNLKKSQHFYIVSLCLLKESVRVFPRFSVKKEVFFPEKKKKALAVFFRPK